MKNLIVYLFLIISALLFGTCDVIEGPYLEDHDPGGTEVEETLKNVLVLEFTGHTCKSCPKAHKTLKQLEDLYGERIVPVAFHTGYFARTQSGDKFTTDFRTSQGTEMEIYFEFVSFPIGVVGNLDKGRLSSYSSWPAEADAFMDEESQAELSSSSVYDEGNNEIQVKIDIKNKSALEGYVRLAVYLVEDGIISWQKDEDQDPIDVEDYVHNHVFRTSAGSVWGEALLESECTPDANAQISRSMTMDSSWVPENCTIVSYLYEAVSREVIQCTSELLIK